MTELPVGWRASTLGELGRYLNGRGFKKSEWTDHGRPIIRIQNLTGSGSEFNYFAGEPDERYTARAGDLLVSWAATLGAYIWPGPEAVVNQHIFKVESNIDVRFHKYLLDYKLEELMRQTHGSGMVHITRGKFDAVPVAVPPMEEQHRIVAALEDHLSRLNAAETGLLSAIRRAAAMRRKAMGQLLDGDYPKHDLADLLELSIGGIWGEPPGESDLDVKVLRVTELRDGGGLDPSTAASRSCRESHYRSRALQQGDLLLEKSGGGPTSPVGRVGLVPHLHEPSVCSNFMQLMRPDPSKVTARYLHLYLTGFHVSGRTAAMQTASTNIRNIKASDYLGIPVAVPDLLTQHRLVDEVDGLIERCSTLEHQIDLGLARLRSLRRALLGAAFSGTLVPPGETTNHGGKELLHV